MIERSIRLLTYAFLAVFPFGLLVRFKLATNVYITPQDVIVGLLFMLLVFRKSRIKSFKNYLLLQAIFLSVGLLSLLINQLIYRDVNVFVSVAYTMRYIMYLSLILVPQYFKNSVQLINAFVLSGTTLLLIGFFQLFFYSDMRPYIHLGWDNHLYRLVATFFDPNFVGVYFALFTLFLFIVVSKLPFKKSIPYLLLAFFSVVAVYVTYSRTALLSFVASLCVLAIFTKRLKLLLIFLFAGVAVLFLVSDTHIEGLNPFRTASVSHRFQTVLDTQKVIEKNTLIGVGFNAYRYAQIRYDLRSTAGASISNADAGSDNSYLFVLATVGIFGLIPYILSYWFLIKEIFSLRTVQSKIVIAMICCVLVSSIFTNILFYTPILAWFFLSISLFRGIKGSR